MPCAFVRIRTSFSFTMTCNQNGARQLDRCAGESSGVPAEIQPRTCRKREFRCGPLFIDFSDRTVNVAGHRVRLTGTEYALLCVLAEGAGKVVPQRRIVRKIWGGDFYGKLACLRVCAWSLRKKLRNTSFPELVLTEPGIGYRLAVTE